MEHLNVPPTNHVKVLDGQGWVGLIDHLGTESTIVNAARVSFGKLKNTMEAGDVKLLEYLIANKHTSPMEHMVFTFSIHCPLFVRGQWHRHRTWSYNEISRRYTEIDMEFYTPGELRRQAESNRQASFSDPNFDGSVLASLIADHNKASLELYEKLLAALSEGKCAREVELDEDEKQCLYDTPLLTMKPVIYVANVGEDEVSGEPLNNPDYIALKEQAKRENSQIIAICAQLEAEIAELDGEEKEIFLADLGIEESGLDRLIKASYSLLGLISFLTAGPQEVRAWTIKKGTKAPQAAGKIHTDFERGFIRAEVIAFEDMKACGTMANAKSKGLVRSEGKEYVMKDGDIVNFLFNV